MLFCLLRAYRHNKMLQRSFLVKCEALPAVFVVILLLAVSGSVLSVPAASSRGDSKPVDNLVAAAQSALRQGGKISTALTPEDDGDVDRHRKTSFTSPVDGYFIQARRTL